MTWTVTAYALPPLVSAGLAAALAWEGWRHRERAVARPFAGLMATITLWSLAYAIQLGYTTEAAQVLWFRVATTIGSMVPVPWLLLTIIYAGREGWLTRRRVLLLAAEPVAFVALVWTNASHGLVWTGVRFDPTATPVVIDTVYGTAYYVNIAFAYLLVVAGIGLLHGVLVRSDTVYRRQSSLLVLGAVVPLAANVAFTLGYSPIPNLDLTTSTFTLTGVVFALALFRFDLLDLTPIARREMVEAFGGGLVVVDEDHRVVEFNDVATDVLPGVDRVGRDLGRQLAFDSVEALDGRMLSADSSGGGCRTRTFEVSVSPLEDYRDEAVGSMIAMQDVTDRREYEQRLEVANRLLRHNLRNDMTKIIGLADTLADDTAGEARTAASNIGDVARDVADMGRKARQIETTLDASRTDGRTVEVAPVVTTVVEDSREDWPSASISLSVSGEPTAVVPGRDLLAAAVDNAVENAVIHNDREEPEVAVTVEQDGGDVVIEVRDDGPGIPEMELEAVTAGGEDALDHASGIGLWLLHWVATASGGTLAFEENEPRGSVVVFRLPTPDGSASSARTATS